MLFRRLADDYRSLSREYPLAKSTGHQDFARYFAWLLFTHRLTFTTLHQDAAGLLSVIEQLTGYKLWFGLVWVSDPKRPITGRDRIRRAWCISRGLFYEAEYDTTPPWIQTSSAGHSCVDWAKYDPVWVSEHRRASWVVIPVTPGMIVYVRTTTSYTMQRPLTVCYHFLSSSIQPADMPHAVLNLTAGAATGGHLLTWESLPLTRIARRLERLVWSPRSSISNEYHPDMEFILATMLMSLAPWSNVSSLVSFTPSPLTVFFTTDHAQERPIIPAGVIPHKASLVLSLVLLLTYGDKANVSGGYRQPVARQSGQAPSPIQFARELDMSMDLVKRHFLISFKNLTPRDAITQNKPPKNLGEALKYAQSLDFDEENLLASCLSPG